MRSKALDKYASIGVLVGGDLPYRARINGTKPPLKTAPPDHIEKETLVDNAKQAGPANTAKMVGVVPPEAGCGVAARGPAGRGRRRFNDACYVLIFGPIFAFLAIFCKIDELHDTRQY